MSANQRNTSFNFERSPYSDVEGLAASIEGHGPVVGTRPGRKNLRTIVTCGFILFLAYIVLALGLFQKQYPSLNSAFLISHIAWFAISGSSLAVLCVEQHTILRRLPILVILSTLAVCVSKYTLDFESITIVALSPFLVTIIGLFTLYSSPEALATVTEIAVRIYQGEAEPPPQKRPLRSLWRPDESSSFARSAVDPSNIASAQIQIQRSRAHVIPLKARKTFSSSSQSTKTPLRVQTSGPSAPLAAIGRGLSSMPNQAMKEDFDIMLQPETRPISQEQLVAEVKGIYAGLVMVEAKCIEVDNKQAALAHADGGNPPKLNNEQWQALIALHRTLLHEHHDFFLASQHPSASPALRRLASKYAMPARMWRHGIHSFLELLRHRLPASLDHMLAFIYLAYSMMALLYETVPAFEDTWIECLGDLGRYRMAIEDDDIRDREVWTGVARHWYSKASDKAPTTGRLYHHLAILARPNALQQLFYYSKSLCVAVPFSSARESILTLFEPVLNSDNGQGQYRLPPLDMAFVKAHGLLFTNKEMHKFDHTVDEFLSLLNTQIGRVTRKFMEQGYHIAVANHVAMVGFASSDNVLMKPIFERNDTDDIQMDLGGSGAQSMMAFKEAQHLSNSTTRIVLDRVGHPNVLPFIHITLISMLHLAQATRVIEKYLDADFPWKELAVMLNTLLSASTVQPRIENDSFPLPEKVDAGPFPEDFAVRGLLWAENYVPDDWFMQKSVDEEKYHERASMTAQRKERIVWLTYELMDRVPYLYYNSVSRRLFESPAADHEHFTSLTRVHLSFGLLQRPWLKLASITRRLGTRLTAKIQSCAWLRLIQD
ncbi:hypothetical protein B0J14DRAFT_555256 [Halenospora varia]|nr:hypothetical protein B0J14DRAFT_555256 [Halenospora varia]